MYPSRYYDLFNAGMSYAAKFDLLLCLGRRLRGLESDGKAERGEQEASATSFFSGGRQMRVPLAAYVAILNRLYDAKDSRGRGALLSQNHKND
jgi:hypothetical protein